MAGAILETCEREAEAQGFRSLELMATLPGVPFYAARGYEGSERVSYEIAEGVKIEFVPMRKDLEWKGIERGQEYNDPQGAGISGQE